MAPSRRPAAGQRDVEPGRARCCRRSRSASVGQRAPRAGASSSRLASLAAAPDHRPLVGGSVPSERSSWVSAPWRPRKRTRRAFEIGRGAPRALDRALRASPAMASTRGCAAATSPGASSARLRLGRLGELGEGRRVADRHLGEHLAIEQDAGLLQRGDEHGVREPGLRAGRVDPGDPQPRGTDASWPCDRGTRIRPPAARSRRRCGSSLRTVRRRSPWPS